MPTKRVILAIVGAALLFGAAMSGCNRNRDMRSASSTRRPVKNTNAKRQERERDRDLAQAPNVRPAEVLAASVKRPQRRRVEAPYSRPVDSRPHQMQYQDYYRQAPVGPVYSQPSYELAQAYEPLPEPVPVSALSSYGQSGVYTLPQTATAYDYNTYQAYQHQSSYQAQQTWAPVYNPYEYAEPAPVYEPAQVVHPSPELAMARAALSPLQQTPVSSYVPPMQPAGFVPPIEPQMFSAPIPELEPVRYQRVAQQQPQPPLMSGRVPQLRSTAAPANHEIRRALEPLSQPAAPTQGWVPSPATAMGY